jgi:polyisoprenoid-binding protein YceI
VDPDHASVVFSINHLGFSNVHGIFPGMEGKIVLNETSPDKSSFEVKVAAERVNTGVHKRDRHLRSPDFFSVKQFPDIVLKSKSIKKSGSNSYDIVADLTLHGVTKPVHFTFHRLNTGKGPNGALRTGGDAEFKLKRSDYGMTFMNGPGQVGDEVSLSVSLEAVRQ